MVEEKYSTQKNSKADLKAKGIVKFVFEIMMLQNSSNTIPRQAVQKLNTSPQ